MPASAARAHYLTKLNNCVGRAILRAAAFRFETGYSCTSNSITAELSEITFGAKEARGGQREKKNQTQNNQFLPHHLIDADATLVTPPALDEHRRARACLQLAQWI